ncbi:MAG: type IX secretion system outer membrane channel protein PorV [Bacteroidales bacterium]|nr:type IX secretion system outer membrane channel protein PorV [Bacteroidales bacterium]
MKKTATFALLIALCSVAAAQYSETGQTNNFISTGMPILLIAPDAVSSAMGDAGVASTPDIYSAHWNNAKFAFIDGDMGVSTTYTPWLRNLHVGDMNLLYLGGYYRINERSTAAASLTYFSLGDIDHTNSSGDIIGTLHPNEFAVDATYALKLTDNLSLGASGRFILSDLTNGAMVEDGSGHTATNSAKSLAADVGLYYETEASRKETVALGMFISNLGAKLSYSDDDNNKEFLPANLRIGARYTNVLDDYNKISILFDANKLLVPTPQLRNDTNQINYNSIGVIQGALMSFGDAPGGMSEEVREIQLSAGAEYWYANTFAVRAGYFYEHETKGGRQYITLGAGVKYNIFAFDMSYIIPTTKISNHPLAHTVRIQLSVDLTPGRDY